MNDLKEIAEIVYKEGDNCSMSILKWHQRKVLEDKHTTDLEMQDYYGLVNVVCGFVNLKPEHPLYESIRQDVLNYIDRVKNPMKQLKDSHEKA